MDSSWIVVPGTDPVKDCVKLDPRIEALIERLVAEVAALKREVEEGRLQNAHNSYHHSEEYIKLSNRMERIEELLGEEDGVADLSDRMGCMGGEIRRMHESGCTECSTCRDVKCGMHPKYARDPEFEDKPQGLMSPKAMDEYNRSLQADASLDCDLWQQRIIDGAVERLRKLLPEPEQPKPEVTITNREDVARDNGWRENKVWLTIDGLAHVASVYYKPAEREHAPDTVAAALVDIAVKCHKRNGWDLGDFYNGLSALPVDVICNLSVYSESQSVAMTATIPGGPPESPAIAPAGTSTCPCCGGPTEERSLLTSTYRHCPKCEG